MRGVQGPGSKRRIEGQYSLLKSNELFLYAISFEKEAGKAFVTGYENDTPVLKPIERRSLYDTSPVEFVGDHIPFEMYDLKECLNVQTLRTP